MTYLHTCVGCRHRGDCLAENQLRLELKSLGVRSAKHRCQIRAPLFVLGDPVEILITTTYEKEYDDEHVKEWFPGHFLRQHGAVAYCFIKPGVLDVNGDYTFDASGNGHVKIPMSRVRPGHHAQPASLEPCKICRQVLDIVGMCINGDDAGYLCALKERAALAQGHVDG